jgi:hypothetical protein
MVVTCKPKNEQSTNDKHNEIENKDRKSEHSDSRPKSQRFCIFIFSQCTFLKIILANRTNGTFGFARHTSRPFAKPKEPFFANGLLRLCINKRITFKPNNIIIWH